MNEDDFYDALRGRKYVYLVTGGHGGNANILAYDESHARKIAAERWWTKIRACDEVTEAFKRLNNSFTDEDLDKLEPGLLRLIFHDSMGGHEWRTS